MNYFIHRQDNEYRRCDGIMHEIRQGDTLYKLSRFYKVPIEKLLENNPMIDVYNLKIGDKLCIPIKQNTYLTKKGDTLDWLLSNFDMNYETFRKNNPQIKPFVFEENEWIKIPERS